MKILWFQPSKGDNISIRRQCIASILEERGYSTGIIDVSLRNIPSALISLHREQPDILFANVRAGLYIGYPLARLFGIPVVGDVSDPIEQLEEIHGFPPWLISLLKRVEFWILRRTDANVFVYRSSLDDAREHGVEGRYLPNAVDFGRVARPDEQIVSEARDLLEDEGLDFDKPVVIYIGGLTERYHLGEILEAAKRLSDVQFVFLGVGPLSKTINEQAERYDNIIFLGSVPREMVPGYLHQADIGLCLVNAEQPLKILEYGAAGLPVIVQRGVLEDRFGEAVLAINPSVKELQEAIQRLLQEDSKRNELSDQLRGEARKFDWEDIATGYEGIIEEVGDS